MGCSWRRQCVATSFSGEVSCRRTFTRQPFGVRAKQRRQRGAAAAFPAAGLQRQESLDRGRDLLRRVRDLESDGAVFGELERWLDKVSRETGIPKSEFVREQLERVRTARKQKKFMRLAGSVSAEPTLSARKGYSRK